MIIKALVASGSRKTILAGKNFRETFTVLLFSRFIVLEKELFIGTRLLILEPETARSGNHEDTITLVPLRNSCAGRKFSAKDLQVCFPYNIRLVSVEKLPRFSDRFSILLPQKCRKAEIDTVHVHLIHLG